MTSASATMTGTMTGSAGAIGAAGAGGLVGGMAMAMLSMVVAIGEDGFWSPVRGITSVVFGDEHYGGGFDFWTVVGGGGGHMMNSLVLGLLFGLVMVAFVPRLSGVGAIVGGAVWGIAIWIVMILGIAPALQESDLFVDAVPQWTWFAGHVMFGAAAGLAYALSRSAVRS